MAWEPILWLNLSEKPQRIPKGSVALTGAGQLGSAHVITLVSLTVTLPTSPWRAEASAPR